MKARERKIEKERKLNRQIQKERKLNRQMERKTDRWGEKQINGGKNRQMGRKTEKGIKSEGTKRESE